MKIESFSLLRASKIEKYVSGSFEACGYHWRLVLYPNGRADRDAKDHISLYLEMAEPKPSTTGWHVRVILKMLVYDHRRYKYLTFQDASGIACRFDHMRSEWGFDRLLPHETFDTSGFLDDYDSCTFGIELSVPRDTGKGEYMSIIKGLKNNSCTWTIRNFSDMKDEKNWSDEFNTAIPEGGKLYVEYKLRMKNHSGVRKKHCVKEDQHWFSPQTYSEGFEDFVALSSLKDQGLKQNDSLIVEVEITFMAIVTGLN
ncbi:hypothetical protein RJ639_019413 [Escallonia herrerae]|uniref:MATH domain-containing protein n=1 Tax=Escallonia herrerae TaxID=1293975 RepID=A0AA88V9B5_9ASTE|nr:hypothetical protein RJ639_019413 [Escallonia herrerae]